MVVSFHLRNAIPANQNHQNKLLFDMCHDQGFSQKMAFSHCQGYQTGNSHFMAISSQEIHQFGYFGKNLSNQNMKKVKDVFGLILN